MARPAKHDKTISKTSYNNSLKATKVGEATDSQLKIASDARLKLGKSENHFKKMIALREILNSPDKKNELYHVLPQLVCSHFPYKPLYKEDGTPQTFYTRSYRNGNETITVELRSSDGTLLPYGVMDRVVLTWLQSKVKKQQDNTLNNGSQNETYEQKLKRRTVTWGSTSELLQEMGLTIDGKTYKKLGEAWNRLYNMNFQIRRQRIESKNTTIEEKSQFFVFDKGVLPLESLSDDDLLTDTVMNNCRITFTEDFYDLIRISAVPLSKPLMKLHMDSPMEWDLVAYLTYKSWIAKNIAQKTLVVTWKELSGMIGSSNQEPRQIRSKIKKLIEDLKFEWDDCNITMVRGGNIQISPPISTVVKNKPTLFHSTPELHTQPSPQPLFGGN